MFWDHSPHRPPAGLTDPGAPPRRRPSQLTTITTGAWAEGLPRIAPVTLGITHSLDVYQPVLALTLLRTVEGRDEVMVGVRTPYNVTHPNVMSVPTLRVEPEIAAVWVPHVEDAPLSGPALRRSPDVLRTVSRVVREVMALKLGKADALVRYEVDFVVESLIAYQGVSAIGHDRDVDATERLTMFNAQVRWTEGSDLKAPSASYDPMMWITEEQFAEMVRTRDVGVLNAGLDAVEVCVRGLCMETAVRVLGTHQP